MDRVSPTHGSQALEHESEVGECSFPGGGHSSSEFITSNVTMPRVG